MPDLNNPIVVFALFFAGVISFLVLFFTIIILGFRSAMRAQQRRNDMWGTVAKNLGLHFDKGHIRGRFRNHDIKVATHTRRQGSIKINGLEFGSPDAPREEYLLLEARLHGIHWRALRITPRAAVSRAMRRMGSDELRVGNPFFDDRFCVRFDGRFHQFPEILDLARQAITRIDLQQALYTLNKSFRSFEIRGNTLRAEPMKYPTQERPLGETITQFMKLVHTIDPPPRPAADLSAEREQLIQQWLRSLPELPLDPDENPNDWAQSADWAGSK